MHRAVHRRRRRLAARRRDREPGHLTRSVQQALTTYVTCGGAPVYVWPGGGITFMVDVTRVPDSAFGYVPTPALVAPIEFTLRRDDYAAARRPRRDRPVDDICRAAASISISAASAGAAGNPWPPLRSCGAATSAMSGPQIAWLPDGRRLHLQHGPIDLIIEAFGDAGRSGERAYRAARRALRRPSSTNSSPSCRCCARRSAASRRRFARPGRRAGWRRAVCALPPRASSRRWRRSPARSPRRCWRR